MKVKERLKNCPRKVLKRHDKRLPCMVLDWVLLSLKDITQTIAET